MSFSMLQRHAVRNGLWLSFLVIFFVTGLFAGKAWAAESKRKPAKVAPAITVSTSTSTTSISTSTTTTTTLPVITTTTVAKPIRMQPVASNADWVAQCYAWAAQAGIELPPAAISLIDVESDCSPTAQNPTSSACGIAQNIRGCNSAEYGYDPVAQLIWMNSYVVGRYGSWDAAWEFWKCIGLCRGINKTSTWY